MADKNIKITVRDRRAKVEGSPVIVCGNSDYTITFNFDDEWAAGGARTARYVYVKDGTVKHEDIVFVGNVAEVPTLSNVTFVKVGVFAGELCTTTPARINCELSILCGSGAVQEPTPDVYNQIMALFTGVAEQIEKNKTDIQGLVDGSIDAGKAKTSADAEKLGGETAEEWQQKIDDLADGTTQGWREEIDNIVNGTTTVGNASSLGGETAEEWQGKIDDITPTNLLRVTLNDGTHNGIAFDRQAGTYILNGTATEHVAIIIGTFLAPRAGQYKLVGCPSGGSTDSYALFENPQDPSYDFGEGVVLTLNAGKTVKIGIRIKTGTTISNLVFKPMITTNLDLTYDDFKMFDYGFINDEWHFIGSAYGTNKIEFAKNEYREFSVSLAYSNGKSMFNIPVKELRDSEIKFHSGYYTSTSNNRHAILTGCSNYFVTDTYFLNGADQTANCFITVYGKR